MFLIKFQNFNGISQFVNNTENSSDSMHSAAHDDAQPKLTKTNRNLPKPTKTDQKVIQS